MPRKRKSKKKAKLSFDDPWTFSLAFSAEEIKNKDLRIVYRLDDFELCRETEKPNCEINPFCFFGLGEQKWTKKNFSIKHKTDEVQLRKKGDYAGLKNCGNTCYLNVFVQLLFHNRMLRSAILKWKQKESKNTEQRNPLKELQLLFTRLQLSEQKIVDPTNFIRSLDIDINVQEDAEEFGISLFATLEKLLTDQNDDQIKAVLRDSVEVGMKLTTKCQTCFNKTRTYETFIQLQLNVKGTLKESLDEYFSETSISDEYWCNQCNKNTSAKRTSKITKLPPILNIGLLRYHYDVETNQRLKDSRQISIPDTLVLQNKRIQEYCERDEETEVKYYLTAMINHIGTSAYSGHFLIKIKDLKTGHWTILNDQNVYTEENEDTELNASANEQKFGTTILSSAEVYTLVYTSDVCNENFDFDPEIPGRLKDIVKQEDAAAVNPYAYLIQRRKEVEWLYPLDQIQVPEGACTTESIIFTSDEMPARLDRYSLDELDFISTSWIRKWLNPKKSVPEINNLEITCEHKKLAPPYPEEYKCPYKAIPSPLANVMYSKYGGGPRFQYSDLCNVCVTSICQIYRDRQKLKEDIKKVETLVQKCDKKLEEFRKQAISHYDIVKGTAWAPKTNLKKWGKVAEINNALLYKVGLCNESDSKMLSDTSEMLCKHGNLSLDDSKRKLIPKEASDIIATYFKEPFTLDAVHYVVCQECKQFYCKNFKICVSFEAQVTEPEQYPTGGKPSVTENYNVNGNTTIQELKQMICDKWGIDILAQKLLYNEIQLNENEKSFSDYKIQPKSTVCLYVKQVDQTESLVEESMESIQSMNENDDKVQDLDKFEIAIRQKEALIDVYHGNNRPFVDKKGNFFVVPTKFVIAWKKFVDHPDFNDQVTEIANKTLLCKHEKFIQPIQIFGQFIRGHEEKAFTISAEEWEKLQTHFQCDIPIQGTVKTLGKPENVSYSPDVCKECISEMFDNLSNSSDDECSETEKN